MGPTIQLSSSLLRNADNNAYVKHFKSSAIFRPEVFFVYLSIENKEAV